MLSFDRRNTDPVLYFLPRLISPKIPESIIQLHQPMTRDQRASVEFPGQTSSVSEDLENRTISDADVIPGVGTVLCFLLFLSAAICRPDLLLLFLEGTEDRFPL